MEDELTKNTQLRNNEYFRKQFETDYLYKLGLNNHKFTDLLHLIILNNLENTNAELIRMNI